MSIHLLTKRMKQRLGSLPPEERCEDTLLGSGHTAPVCTNKRVGQCVACRKFVCMFHKGCGFCWRGVRRRHTFEEAKT